MVAMQPLELNEGLKKRLDAKINLYLGTPLDDRTQHKTLVFTDIVEAWETELKPVTINDDYLSLSIPLKYALQETNYFVSSVTHYLSQQTGGETVHPYAVLVSADLHLILTSYPKQAFRMNPMKVHVKKQFRVGPSTMTELGTPSNGSSSESDSASSPHDSSGPSNSPTQHAYRRHVGDRNSSSCMLTPTSSLVNRGPRSTKSSTSDRSSASDDDNTETPFYLTPSGLGSMASLNDILTKFATRGTAAADAVMIFTFTEAGDKWKTSEDRPAIIIPSKLLPPIPADFYYAYSGRREDHDFVHEMMTCLATEIEVLEGKAPFISCIDFGPYENGREVDFVLSRHVHEAPLYLHSCNLSPSKECILPAVTASVSARYHHRSSSSASCSFDTQLFVERTKWDEVFPFSADRLRSNDEPMIVAHCPPTTDPDTIDAVTSRLSKRLRKYLDNVVMAYQKYCSEKAQRQVLIFTNNASLWEIDENTVIVWKSGPPTPLAGYDHDKHDIAEDITRYLVETAKSEMGERIVATYVRLENQYTSYEVHLILLRSFDGGAQYIKRVRDILPPVVPVHCLSCVPSDPVVFAESLLWVERQTSSDRLLDTAWPTKFDEATEINLERGEWQKYVHIQPSDVEANYLSRPILSRLSETLRANLDSKMKCFIEWQDSAAEPLTVVFTKEANMWRMGENRHCDMSVPLSPIPRTCYRGEGSEIASEITDYLLQLADRLKMTSLKVSCLWMEQWEGLDFHLVMSQCEKPALLHLESWALKPDPSDVEDAHAETTESTGVYCYRSPTEGVHRNCVDVRVTRKLGGDDADQEAKSLESIVCVLP